MQRRQKRGKKNEFFRLAVALQNSISSRKGGLRVDENKRRTYRAHGAFRWRIERLSRAVGNRGTEWVTRLRHPKTEVTFVTPLYVCRVLYVNLPWGPNATTEKQKSENTAPTSAKRDKALPKCLDRSAPLPRNYGRIFRKYMREAYTPACF